VTCNVRFSPQTELYILLPRLHNALQRTGFQTVFRVLQLQFETRFFRALPFNSQ
jgi:hypothetical protein